MDWILFRQDERMQRLERIGDPLDVPAKIIPWEIFREKLEKIYFKPNRKPQE